VGIHDRNIRGKSIVPKSGTAFSQKTMLISSALEVTRRTAVVNQSGDIGYSATDLSATADLARKMLEQRQGGIIATAKLIVEVNAHRKPV
jgi:hypothetical protein